MISTRITVTKRTYGGDQTPLTVFDRTYTTAAGARRGLVAAVVRETIAWGNHDNVSMISAERAAERWDGSAGFAETVKSWNKTSELRFEAR